MQRIWVDFPKFNFVTNKVTWEGVAEFNSKNAKEEAIAWLRERLGKHLVDEEGRVRLLTFGEEGPDTGEGES